MGVDKKTARGRTGCLVVGLDTPCVFPHRQDMTTLLSTGVPAFEFSPSCPGTSQRDALNRRPDDHVAVANHLADEHDFTADQERDVDVALDVHLHDAVAGVAGFRIGAVRLHDGDESTIRDFRQGIVSPCRRSRQCEAQRQVACFDDIHARSLLSDIRVCRR